MNNEKLILTVITGALSEQGMQAWQFTEWLQFPLHALILFLSIDFKLKKRKRGVKFHLDLDVVEVIFKKKKYI